MDVGFGLLSIDIFFLYYCFLQLSNFNRLLFYSNILFREFALISMWRIPSMPNGAHKLLSLLAEPLRQHSETFSELEDDSVLDNLKEFQDWVCYAIIVITWLSLLLYPFWLLTSYHLIESFIFIRASISPVMQHIATGSKLNWRIVKPSISRWKKRKDPL